MENMVGSVFKKTEIINDSKLHDQLVGIGEIKVAAGPQAELRVVALGSCVAVIFYARKIQTIAVAHVALPDSAAGMFNKKQDGYFADTAIEKLIAIFREQGVSSRKDIKIKLVGGASIMDPNGTFDIGKRNILAVRKYLWQHNLGALSEDVGQSISRSITVYAADGAVNIRSPYKGTWTI